MSLSLMIESPKKSSAFQSRGFKLDRAMKFFFGTNAACSILALALITIFLFREGVDFFPQNAENLRAYRRSGLEFVDIMRSRVDAHQALSRSLQAMRERALRKLIAKTGSPEQAATALTDFDAWIAEFDASTAPLDDLISELSDIASANKEAAAAGTQFDISVLLQALPRYEAASHDVAAKHGELMPRMPLPVAGGEADRKKFLSEVKAYEAGLSEITSRLAKWNPNTPVPWYRAVTSFLFGSEWITNSFWQDFYGVVPLFTGSALVSLVAMAIAVPFGVCAAIYVNEVATLTEQHFIKPYIEFISAIPSVVLGFFGIAVFGETVRLISQASFLKWVPFFPISERLNVFTAGCLLALMAVPTIFSLSEDALNNVPRAFKEASFALGGTRLQTIVRILVPASLSGIISAVLLGFGRVIGETMVVLLCAGNRIAIPDFTQGVGAIFQPVHTMTGIIAQEMGEVVRGSIHYRALFMVGMLLFVISLGLNWAAQAIVRRYRISIG
ncbi:MAG: phosphate ABC transporter permease subunit PstC [Verrucomicrobiota bacterium]|nr:phosphate ABC transporter permease subunit PstC [Verrucomicrobiota bacterium]